MTAFDYLERVNPDFCPIIALNELDDALGCEQRTAQIRAEIDERRRRQAQQTDPLLAQELMLDPLDPTLVAMHSNGYLPFNSRQLFEQQLIIEAQLLNQQMFGHTPPLQRDQLTRQRRLLHSRGVHSLADDLLGDATSAESASFLMPDGHHTQEYLSRRNQSRQPHHQSRSLDMTCYDSYLSPIHSATPPIAPTVISNQPMSAMYADAAPYVYANGKNLVP